MEGWPEFQLFRSVALVERAGRALLHFATQRFIETERPTVDDMLLSDSDSMGDIDLPCDCLSICEDACTLHDAFRPGQIGSVPTQTRLFE